MGTIKTLKLCYTANDFLNFFYRVKIELFNLDYNPNGFNLGEKDFTIFSFIR